MHIGAFCQFPFGGFTTMAVINPPETKLDKCTSVHSEANEGLGIFTSIEAAF